LKNFLVEIKPTAEQDLAQRYEQIAEESPQNALNWYLRMITAIEKLDLLAERCPLAPEDRDLNLGIRHLVIGDYRALYIINDEVVEILHVRHSRRSRIL